MKSALFSEGRASFVQQPFEGVELSYSIVRYGRVVIQCQQIFRIMVGDAVERRQLAFQRVFITDGQHDLIILYAAIFDRNKLTSPSSFLQAHILLRICQIYVIDFTNSK